MPGRKKLTNRLLNTARVLGVFKAMHMVSPSVLTVLNYHRIDDAFRPGFDTFVPNVSATPALFAQQMDYVKRNYNAITCEHLNAFRVGETDLPQNPLLITFDDGYSDNYTNAFPILVERKLPALIFLATDYMGKGTPFYWDYVAYCFCHTQRQSVDLPMLGPVSWTDPAGRNAVVTRWINSIKQLPEHDKQRILAGLAGLLGVNVPDDAFAGLHATWDQVRDMSRNGIEMGAHTASHPILTRIPLSQVEDELLSSKQKVENEIGRSVIGFAYPNGGSDDFSPDVVQLVEKVGFKLAFSLIKGTTRYADIRNNPLTIHRIYLGMSDQLPRFVAKLSINRFIQ